MLKTELEKQMQQRRDESQVEQSQNVEQLKIFKKLDKEHWESEQVVKAGQKQRRIAYDQDLRVQMQAKEDHVDSGDLHLNREYLANIKNMQA